MTSSADRVRVGIHVGHWEREPRDVVVLAREAETCGLESVWVSETWGSDAVVLATSIATMTERIDVGTGVLQMAGRAPTQTAMAALTLDHVSGGRFRLGIGTSGPQVVEGWYGVPFDDPIGRTREYIAIVRAVLRREEPVVAGEHATQLAVLDEDRVRRPASVQDAGNHSFAPQASGIAGPPTLALAHRQLDSLAGHGGEV